MTPGLAPGWLAGRLVDRDGRALPAARVMTWSHSREGNKAVRANGDEGGRFLLGPLPAGCNYVVWCEAPGCARLRVGDEQAPHIAVFPDATNDLGDIVLGDEIVAVGRVLDPDGLPISGATVVLRPHYQVLAHTMACDGEPFEAHTGPDGTFRFGCLSPCYAHVEVVVPDFPRLQTGVCIKACERRIDFGSLRLDRARTHIAGVVTDRLGRPIVGVGVSAKGDDNAYAWTDETGRFQLVARAAGVSDVTVSPDLIGINLGSNPDYSVALSAANLRAIAIAREVARDPTGIRVTLELSRALEGQVRDAVSRQLVTIADLRVCEARRRELDGAIMLYG